MRRFLIILAFIGIALPAFAQDLLEGFQFRGLTWGQKPEVAKQALADTAKYKMEMTASDARRELYTTTFAERAAGLTLEFRDGKLAHITLATAEPVPQSQAGSVFDSWASALTEMYGPPLKAETTDATEASEDGGEESTAMDLFGDVPEKNWKVRSTDVMLVQKVEGTGYGVVVRFQRAAGSPTPVFRLRVDGDAESEETETDKTEETREASEDAEGETEESAGESAEDGGSEGAESGTKFDGLNIRVRED